LRIGLNAPPPVVELARLPGVTQVEDLGGGQFRLHHDPDVVISPSLLEQARIGGWSVWQMTPEPVGLEQVFVDLMLKQETGA
jgi:ABC-2 type transport system ATP-binding protein